MKALLLFSRIALRNVRRNPRRSLITVLAIAFGLCCLIVFQAMKAGLHQEMVLSTLRLDAGAVQIHGAGYEVNLAVLHALPEPEQVREALAAAGVKRYAFRLKAPALLLAGERSSSVLLSGVDPGQESSVTFIASRVEQGGYLTDPASILLGSGLARSLEVGVGDRVTLMVQDAFGQPAARTFAVGGLYRTALASFDRSHVYLNLATARDFLGAGDMVTEVAVGAPPEQAEPLAAVLAKALPARPYQVRTWQAVAPDVHQLIELNDATMRLLIVIVFAIVAMGITNTMTTVIFERFRELGIMTAIGTGPGGIVSMILLESFFLGLLAAGVGGIGGVGLCLYLARYGIDLTALTSSNQYFATSHVLKAHLVAGDLAAAVAITLLTAVLASVYPAWKAARLQPVQAITHT